MMLDTRLDSMSNTTGIAKQLCLKGIDQEIYLPICSPFFNIK